MPSDAPRRLLHDLLVTSSLGISVVLAWIEYTQGHPPGLAVTKAGHKCPEGDPSPSAGASAGAQLLPFLPVGARPTSGPVPQGSAAQGRRGSPGRLGQRCMYVLVAQSCLTLCDPMDCNPPGSSIHGIFRARILEWVAFSTWARTRIYERGNLDSAEDLWAWVQPPQQKSDPVGKWQCT